ncbi:flavin reductase family protein [Nonomuraea sp. 3N208]|uniref:flavin reductase family protein n=1 Tax=Nonomuraea sp. 3N208 TaxID=3457421 RepID=UPI003FCCC77D
MSTHAARLVAADGCRSLPTPHQRRIRNGAAMPTGPNSQSANGHLDSLRFRQVLGRFATGVVAITALDPLNGRPCGLAANSFTSVSLNPPLVAFCVAHTSTSWPRVRGAKIVTVNVLAEHQQEVCAQMATKGGDKFAGLEWTGSPGGNPVLEGALAWIDCAVEAEHPAGDHMIVVARVLQLDTHAEGGPLVFFRGGYGGFVDAS